METRLLLWIHAHASPALDAAFRLSHQLGTLPACTVIVLGAAAWLLRRGEKAEALLFVALGLTTLGLQEGLKALFARPRPHLWPWMIPQSDYSMPSGHALAAATFYPLLARVVARRWPRAALPAYVMAVVLALFIGIGRLYLGVHWPSDVVVGWTLGAGQTALGIALVERRRTTA
jgi:undecaprenyl-diphosphatase